MSILSASVIIATWRRESCLRALLSDLANQQDVKGEVIVVDQNNPPCDQTVYKVFEQTKTSLKLRILRRPLGVVAARNAGAAESMGDILLFLDDDVLIEDPFFIKKHLENFSDANLSAVCGQELVPPDFAVDSQEPPAFDNSFEECIFFPRNLDQRREACVLTTCNCSIRASVWKEMGGLDEAFRGNSYGDDADLVLRMYERGQKVVFDPNPSVRHLKFPVGGVRLTDPSNPFSECEKYVSVWIFFFRHVPPKWKGWYFWHGILRKSLLLKRNFYSPHRWPAILIGLVQAMKEGRRVA